MNLDVRAATALVVKLGLELSTLHGESLSARLQRGPLGPLVVARLAVAGLVLAGFFTLPALFSVLLLGVGELLERTLFFRAVDAPKMPGVFTA